jgi:DNA modification methylase
MIDLTGQESFLIHAHVLDALHMIPPNSVQTIITSPPYWGMRRYQTGLSAAWPDHLDTPFGTEPKPEQYVERSRVLLEQLQGKLRNDGVIWWNLGDTYFTRTIIRESSSERLAAFEGRRKDSWRDAPLKRTSSGHSYLKDKDLTLLPFLVAVEAQKLGFWVRSVITWEKESVVPEPQTDRPVLSHEYVLMLTKSRFYKWNRNAATEAAASDKPLINGEPALTRQLRSVWRLKTSAGRNGHPAPFPDSLVERCVRLSTEIGDMVLDPFIGSGTTALVAHRLGRRFIGMDNVASYLDQAAAMLEKSYPRIMLTRYTAAPCESATK